MEFLNYHHLRYFWHVAREGSLTRAASRLRVSQPTMSAQIRALEDVLGEKLFRRGGRNLVLTETGQQVFGYAEEIFSLGEDLLNTVKQRPTTRPLRLHLGVTDGLPKVITYKILKPAFELPRAVQISCRETKLADLLPQLVAFRLDIVLADEPASSASNLKVFNHRLGECGVTFCAEPRLAARLRRRFPASLDGAPALLPMADTGFRRSLEQWFRARGLRPRLIGEFEDSALLQVLAAHGHGLIAVPTLVVSEVMRRFGFARVGRTDECQQQFYAITPERKLTHPAVAAITANARTRLFAHAANTPFAASNSLAVDSTLRNR